MSSNSTLFGGRKAIVTFLNGQTEEIGIRQLPLRDYEKAFQVLGDEMELTALICGKSKSWIVGTMEDGSDGLQPESYEDLVKAAREVNEKGFFVWSARRADRAREQMRENAELMAALPPEAMKLAVEAGKPLPTSSPTTVPVPRR